MDQSTLMHSPAFYTLKQERRIELWNIQEYCCAYCGIETELPSSGHYNPVPNMATIDHILARDNDGWDNPTNMLMCCVECNMRKGNRPLDAFMRERIHTLPLERLLAVTRVARLLARHFHKMHNGNGRWTLNPYVRLNLPNLIQLERLRPKRELDVIYDVPAPAPEPAPEPVPESIFSNTTLLAPAEPAQQPRKKGFFSRLLSFFKRN